MPKCINDSTRTYKGTEPSPKGIGYCAHAMNIGIEMKGKDKNMWKIKKTKNGVKRWTKITNKKSTNKKSTNKKSTNKKSIVKKSIVKKSIVKKWEHIKLIKPVKKKKWTISLEMFFNLKVIHPNKIINYIKNRTIKKLLTKIKEEIIKLEINVFIIPLVLSKDDKYWLDYPHSYILKYYGDYYLDCDHIKIIIYMEKDISLNRNRSIVIQYNIPLKKRKLLAEILNKNFGDKFVWSGKLKDAMLINY